jgi:hypothetical protein
MQLEQFNHFVSVANAEHVLFYYNGALNQNAVAAIGDVLKQRLYAQGASGVTARKVFSTFIEMAQNILHYAADPAAQDEARYGALAVSQVDGRFAVMCGNLVATGSVPRIREKILAVQAMSPDEIKDAYKRQLRGETDAESKGAGLGFLTMARDASAPIEFVFADPTADNPDSQFLFLRAVV